MRAYARLLSVIFKNITVFNSLYKMKIVSLQSKNNEIVYCICPGCKSARKKVDGIYNIIKRGKERNGITRFFCNNCSTWFNEKTSDSMIWYKR